MKVYTIILFVLITTAINAQNVKRAYRLLEKDDYEKALDQFKDAVSENPQSASANLGLAFIYSNPNKGYYDLLKAWRKIKITEENLKSISQEDLEIIKEYYINTETRRSSRSVEKKILITRDEILNEFIKLVREGNNLELVYRVLEEFPDFRYYDNAIHIRNYLEFREAEKKNTIEAFLKFIEEFPDAAQVPLAQEQLHEIAWKEAKRINLFDTYNNFISSYPNAVQVSQAIKARDHAAFVRAKSANTIQAFEKFIQKYPDALDVMEARNLQMELIYERAKQVNTIEGYNDFISRYPAGKQYVDIFNLKAKELGENYVAINKFTDFTPAWVRAYDNTQNNDFYAAFAGDLQKNGIIIANTKQDDTLGFNAWVIGLDNNTKMQWNKIVGDVRNDWVYDAEVDNAGNIIACGFTNASTDTLDGEAWVFKLDKNGKKIWNRSIKYPVAKSVAVNSENEIILGGYYPQSKDTNRFYLLKLNEKGKKLWRREYSNYGTVYDVYVDSEDNITTAADNWIFKLNNEGYIIWEQYVDTLVTIKSIDYDPSGNVIALGEKHNMPWLAQFSNDGNLNWEKGDFAIGYDSIFVADVAVGPLSIIISGAADNDAIIVKTNLTGDIISIKQYGTDGNELIPNVRKMNSDMFIFGLSGKLEDDYDVVLMMITP